MIQLALALALLFVPLAVYRVVEFTPPASYDRFTGGGWYSDLFSREKAALIVVAAVFAGLGMILSRFRPRWSVLLFVCPLALLTMLSAAFSSHPDVIWTGAPGLSEGLCVLISYLVLMLAASDARHWDRITKYLAISVCVMTVAGVAEYFGYSYLSVAPHWLTGLDLPISRGSNAHVSAMLGNSNHLGTYCALALPFFLTLCGTDRKRESGDLPRYAWMGAAILLAMSHSRGGAVGAAAGCMVGYLRGR